MRPLLITIGLLAAATTAAAQPPPTADERPRTERAPEPDAADAATDDAALPNPVRAVYFAVGEHRVPVDARGEIEDAAAWLRAHPYRLLVLEGHASARGGARANLRLSQRRADAVRDALIGAGADPHRVVVTAYGEREATADRADDRRVAIRGTIATFRELVQTQHGIPPRDTREARR